MIIAGRGTSEVSRARFWIALSHIFSSFGNSIIKIAQFTGLNKVILIPLSVTLLRNLNNSMAPMIAGSKLHATLRLCRAAIINLGVFSGISNILMLTGSFYMLQIYDRVLPSRNVATLIGLSILALILYAFQGTIDVVRARINVRIGRFFDAALSGQVYNAIVQMPLKARGDGDGMQPLRDLDQVRSFLSSWGPSALFDLPWMPIYLVICFLFHFWIGVTALLGTIVLVVVAIMTEFKTRAPTKAVAEFARTRNSLAASGRRNAEVLSAMGMAGRAGALWYELNRDYLVAHERASDVTSGLGGFSKVFRTILQSGVLAVGAFLVIRQEATAGIIIASSILTSRALAPIELAIANWKGFMAARQSMSRLYQLVKIFPEEQEHLALPAPKAFISVEAVSVTPPGEQKLVVNNITFQLKAGQGLGVIGPSGSGKSSLVRTLVGVWQPVRGKIRLDHAALEHWAREVLGQHVGYLPQDVELFDGTVAANISRFETDADPQKVLAASVAAGVHKLILSMPDGYGTQIGESGAALSAGQRQRVALARALYGDPFLVVLDEPSSNLDAEGEEALTQAILGVRARGGIAIIVAHRPSALAAVDHVLVMDAGGARTFGEKDDVLKAMLRPSTPVAMPKGGCSRQDLNRMNSDTASAFKAIQRHRLFGVALVVFLTFGIGGWAATTDLAGALIAPGSLVVGSHVKEVQHPTGGIIGELLVHDGDRVKEGDLLVHLDDTTTRANLAIYSKGLDELTARKARLKAERDGRDALAFHRTCLHAQTEPDVADIIASEKKLFDLRRNARLGEKAQLNQRIEQLKDEIGGSTRSWHPKHKRSR